MAVSSTVLPTQTTLFNPLALHWHVSPLPRHHRPFRHLPPTFWITLCIKFDSSVRHRKDKDCEEEDDEASRTITRENTEKGRQERRPKDPNGHVRRPLWRSRYQHILPPPGPHSLAQSTDHAHVGIHRRGNQCRTMHYFVHALIPGRRGYYGHSGATMERKVRATRTAYPLSSKEPRKPVSTQICR